MTHSKLYEHTVYCIPIIIPTLQFTRKDHVYVDGPCQKIGLSELARQDQGLLTVEHFFSIFFFSFFVKRYIFGLQKLEWRAQEIKVEPFLTG